jgi:hypothetical protein
MLLMGPEGTPASLKRSIQVFVSASRKRLLISPVRAARFLDLNDALS